MIPRRWLMDEWREAFVTQARLHELPGDRIGDALAEVDAHCADSGQSPSEAFGDPVSYARVLADQHSGVGPGAPARVPRQARNAAASGLAIIGGIQCLLAGVTAVAERGPGTVTAGDLAGVAGGTAVIVVIATVVLRPGQRHLTALLAAALPVGLAAVVVPQLVWDRALLQLPGWALALIGAALLTVAWWPLVSGRLTGDRVRDPRTGGDRLPTPRWVEPLLRWGMPAGVLLTGVAAVLLITFGARP